MAEENLNDLINWLSSNPIHRFEIYDYNRKKMLKKCVSYAELLSEYSPVTKYFEELADNGVKSVQITQKKKNGSSYVRESCGLNFALSTNDNVAASGGQATMPVATPQRQPTNNIGLMGHGNSLGLGAPEILKMHSQADRYADVKTLAEKLENHNADLIAENKRLERENMRLENEMEKQDKPTAVDKFLNAFAQNPEGFISGIASIKNGGTTPGLNAPEPQKQLSDTKSTVVDMIGNPQVQDDHVAASYYVLMEAVKGNEKFMDEYSKLLSKHKLIQDGSNHTNNGQ